MTMKRDMNKTYRVENDNRQPQARRGRGFRTEHGSHAHGAQKFFARLTLLFLMVIMEGMVSEAWTVVS